MRNELIVVLCITFFTDMPVVVAFRPNYCITLPNYCYTFAY